MTNLIKVLWVEDDPFCIESYPREAEEYGLLLEPFSCWDDAEAELNKNYEDYSAIILDAKCKHHSYSLDSAPVFLMHAMQDLKALQIKKGRLIPWFILSGGDESEINDLILEDRETWDSGRNERYYKKATDRKLLYTRIIRIANDSESIKIKTDLYKDVFDAIERIALNKDVSVNMVDLLRPIHFPHLGDEGKNYNLLFEKARQTVEYIFRSMIEDYGIIPSRDSFYKDGKVVIANCSKYLAGTYGKEPYFEGLKTPKVLSDNIKKIVQVIGASVHTQSNETKNSSDTKIYLEEVENTPYLLRSFAMQLCDFILWYKFYLIKKGLLK